MVIDYVTNSFRYIYVESLMLDNGLCYEALIAITMRIVLVVLSYPSTYDHNLLILGLIS